MAALSPRRRETIPDAACNEPLLLPAELAEPNGEALQGNRRGHRRNHSHEFGARQQWLSAVGGADLGWRRRVCQRLSRLKPCVRYFTLILPFLLVALCIAAAWAWILRVQCAAGAVKACHWLAVFPLVTRVQLPVQLFRGYYVRPRKAANAPALVSFREEGTYFGEWKWPSWRSRADVVDGSGNFSCPRAGHPPVRVLKNLPRLASEAQFAAHVHVLHSPDWQSVSEVSALRARHADGRDVFVHYSHETPVMWPADLDAEYMRLFDLHEGYHRARATAYEPYHALPPYRIGGVRAWVNWMRRPSRNVPWARKRRDRLVVTAVSNCDDYAARVPYIAALVRCAASQALAAHTLPGGVSHCQVASRSLAVPRPPRQSPLAGPLRPHG